MSSHPDAIEHISKALSEIPESIRGLKPLAAMLSGSIMLAGPKLPAVAASISDSHAAVIAAERCAYEQVVAYARQLIEIGERGIAECDMASPPRSGAIIIGPMPPADLSESYTCTASGSTETPDQPAK